MVPERRLMARDKSAPDRHAAQPRVPLATGGPDNPEQDEGCGAPCKGHRSLKAPGYAPASNTKSRTGCDRGGPGASRNAAGGQDEAQRILDERFARGDIDAEKDRRRRQLLQSGRTKPRTAV